MFTEQHEILINTSMMAQEVPQNLPTQHYHISTGAFSDFVVYVNVNLKVVFLSLLLKPPKDLIKHTNTINSVSLFEITYGVWKSLICLVTDAESV